jgi:hypothetical protein
MVYIGCLRTDFYKFFELFCDTSDFCDLCEETCEICGLYEICGVYDVYDDFVISLMYMS